jgi:hypothetical protein
MKIFAACAALVLIAALAFPFASDAYARYKIMHKLAPVLTQPDRVAFEAWNGDAISFVKSLYARCELANGPGAAACTPYRTALE